jgi:hypothetical protein
VQTRTAGPAQKRARRPPEANPVRPMAPARYGAWVGLQRLTGFALIRPAARWAALGTGCESRNRRRRMVHPAKSYAGQRVSPLAVPLPVPHGVRAARNWYRNQAAVAATTSVDRPRAPYRRSMGRTTAPSNGNPAGNRHDRGGGGGGKYGFGRFRSGRTILHPTFLPITGHFLPLSP